MLRVLFKGWYLESILTWGGSKKKVNKEEERISA
jgi:hypothetical protein